MRITLAGLEGAAVGSVDAVLEAHDAAVLAIRSADFRRQLGRALPILHSAGRVIVFGIGPSAALAQYAARLELLNRLRSAVLGEARDV